MKKENEGGQRPTYLQDTKLIHHTNSAEPAQKSPRWSPCRSRRIDIIQREQSVKTSKM